MWRTRVRKRSRETVVCSVGSSDPTSAAGLFLDAAVYARMRGVRPVYLVAGVTAQNSRRVRMVSGLPDAAIVEQLDAILEQVEPDAFRIGLIPRKSACIAIADRLRCIPRRPPIVVDPVMSASTGDRLQRRGGIEGLRVLLSVADIATPNAAEAAALASLRVTDVDSAGRAASRIATRFGCAVLVTGGHLRTGSRVVDVLAMPDGDVRRFSAPRLRDEVRGTGCMLASSLAVALGRGLDLPRAVRAARRFVRAAMVSAKPLGRGRRQFDAAGVFRTAV